MNNRYNQIKMLLNATSASAADITRPLKSIGNGNMLNGVKNISDYSHKEGVKIGIIEGSVITLCVCGVIYLIPKGIKYAKQKIDEKKAHDEMGNNIYTAFSEELKISTEAGDNANERAEKAEKHS